MEHENYQTARSNLDILNHLLGNNNIPVDWDAVCESELIPIILQILDQDPREELLPIITNILINISTAEAKHIEYIYDLKIVFKLFHLLRATKSEIIANDVSNLKICLIYKIKFIMLLLFFSNI